MQIPCSTFITWEMSVASLEKSLSFLIKTSTLPSWLCCAWNVGGNVEEVEDRRCEQGVRAFLSKGMPYSKGALGNYPEFRGTWWLEHNTVLFQPGLWPWLSWTLPNWESDTVWSRTPLSKSMALSSFLCIYQERFRVSCLDFQSPIKHSQHVIFPTR